MFDRLGGWFGRRRIIAYCALLLAGELALSAYFVAATHGWLGLHTGPSTTDFVSFYAAGRLADSGTPVLAYNQTAHYAAEQQARESGIEYNFFYYPPVFLLLCAALAKLPYIAAFLIFEGITLALFLWVVARVLAGNESTFLIPILAFPVVWWNFGWGQNGFLTAALLGGGTLLIDRRPILAGVLFGMICYKPQFGLLLPVALAAGGRWRAFFAAGASAAALLLTSVLAFGTETWLAFWQTASGSPTTYAEGGAKFAAFVTPFGAAMLLGAVPAAAYAVQAAVTGVAIIVVVLAWRRELPREIRNAALAASVPIATPLALIYDLALSAVTVAWLYRSPEGIPANERPLLALAYIAVLDPVQIGNACHIPLATIAALALFAIVARRVVTS